MRIGRTVMEGRHGAELDSARAKDASERRDAMNNGERGQVSRSAAEVYEDLFVPALFEQWTGRVAEAARIERGENVLDVACGTGVLARAVAERVGAAGSVVGVDINEG